MNKTDTNNVLAMTCETYRTQQYMFHNHLHGTSVRNDGNRRPIVYEARLT